MLDGVGHGLEEAVFDGEFALEPRDSEGAIEVGRAESGDERGEAAAGRREARPHRRDVGLVEPLGLGAPQHAQVVFLGDQHVARGNQDRAVDPFDGSQEAVGVELSGDAENLVVRPGVVQEHAFEWRHGRIVAARPDS